jgi:hypothetical protein
MYRFTGLLLLTTAVIWAQPAATIVGHVTDPSGAAVSGATVTARNTNTGLERSVVSGDTGDYELPLLPVTGGYSLNVSKPGFQTAEYTGIVLQVDQHARLDVALKVGSISEKVQVEASAPIINTESGAMGTVIGNKAIVDMPLNVRNYAQLALMLPNAVVQTSARPDRPWSRSLGAAQQDRVPAGWYQHQRATVRRRPSGRPWMRSRN